MDYELVPTSNSFSHAHAPPPPPSFISRIFRPLCLRRVPIPSFSTKQIRYLLIAAVVLVIWALISSLDSQETNNVEGAGTQFAFRKDTRVERRIRIHRQKEVREAFLHAWKGYKEHAWLHDEVMPVSGGHRDPFVGWAATLVDSLDSLYILGLQEEFDHALKVLESVDFTKPHADRVPVFETTIRYLGGLLGAYDVSGGKYPLLLEKADQLGEFLFQAFNTPNGIPVPYYWWQGEPKRLEGGSGVNVAEIGSLSLEFTRLAQLTGKRKYFDGISKVMKYFDDAQNQTKIPGLWPSQMDTREPSFTGSLFTLGAWADSLYEYLPKEHLLLGGQTDQYLRMYRTALESAKKHHFFRAKTPGNQDILFTGSLTAGNGAPVLNPEIQHLACFVGGMVALGSRLSRSPSELALAAQLTNSCVWAYQSTASGIMLERSTLAACAPVGTAGSCDWTDADDPRGPFAAIVDPRYLLRPEAVESLFYMYRLTGDRVWQDKAWTMFRAIATHTRTLIAHACLVDVSSAHPQQSDVMESFWLAETLKYFFLLFSEPDVVSLDEFVLNTEAHPFRLRDNLFTI